MTSSQYYSHHAQLARGYSDWLILITSCLDSGVNDNKQVTTSKILYLTCPSDVY